MSRLFVDLGKGVVLNTLACHLFDLGFKSGARHSEVYRGLTSKLGSILLHNFLPHIKKTCPCNIQRLFQKKKRMNIKLYRKKVDIFDIFAQNIDYGYVLVPPLQGSSNEYPQSMVWIRKKCILLYTPTIYNGVHISEYLLLGHKTSVCMCSTQR